MSNRKAATDPNYNPKAGGNSGNEGRLHPGLRLDGHYGTRAPLRSHDPDPKVRAAEDEEYAERQRAYQAKVDAGKIGPGLRP